MSRLNDLLRRLENSDPALAKDLKREVDALSGRRAFGLNFERHVPEAVELPGRPVRRGDKVRSLPPRGSKAGGDDRLWRVMAIHKDVAGARTASLELVGDEDETVEALVDDLVVIAEFRDPIYPGLVSTAKVERGGDKPYHAVINAENYHALQTLLFTHRAKVDAIYIDPPYNTGAKDWKYNNDYVEGEDLYRHSKWLAFMERRLKLAKELLNPDSSVLIVTIDEKEYLRLGLMLEQTFPESRIQMVSSVISQKGVHRDIGMNRVDEYIYYVFIGSAVLQPLNPVYSGHTRAAARTQVWYPLVRTGSNSTPNHSPGCYYPVYVDAADHIVRIGDVLSPGEAPATFAGLEAILPMKKDGSAGVWQLGREAFEIVRQGGFVQGRRQQGQPYLMYVRSGMIQRITSGEIPTEGKDERGVVKVKAFEGQQVQGARTQWNNISHDATLYGSNLVKHFLPDRRFPYPKSLYAVEDSLRYYLVTRPEAIIVDFFSGSGTTAHAVMRLNKQDGGRRRSISITNNEVGADEQMKLRVQGFRPGDREWERWGICDYITKPRVAAAITGRMPNGDPIKGDYKFTDEFPMADGFEENVEFFTLTYEAPLRVSSNREFSKIAPLLWLRAGSEGRRIDDVSSGWDVADTYGVLADLNHSEAFVEAVAARERISIAFIVTDEDRLFEAIARELPSHVEPVRLYEAYLHNFEIETGRSAL